MAGDRELVVPLRLPPCVCRLADLSFEVLVGPCGESTVPNFKYVCSSWEYLDKLELNNVISQGMYPLDRDPNERYHGLLISDFLEPVGCGCKKTRACEFWRRNAKKKKDKAKVIVTVHIS